MEEVKVVLYGVGAVGKLIARFLLEKQGVKIVGALTWLKIKLERT
jgi:glyceraldehyde-3-phosphate dehydrogenase/erythrose-4-phosphate dehydrogenase